MDNSNQALKSQEEQESIDRCAHCVLSSGFPNIEFDENGVCNFCRDTLLNTSEDAIIAENEEKVASLFEEGKGKSDYDAIVCYSGGKDSTYALMLAVEKYGLKVLSFTFDNGFISPTAFRNINKVVDKLGVDHITFRSSSHHMKDIIRASALEKIYNKRTLMRISSVCNSCISIVNMTAIKMALEKEIPFIIAGFTLGQIPLNSVYYKNNYSFLEESRKVSLDKLKRFAGDGVNNYFTLSERLLSKVKSFPYNVNLLCLEDISEAGIIEKIKPLGWVPPKDVDGCSSNCRLNTFNNYVHKKIFSYSPYELELSHLVRKNQLTRDEAISKLDDQPIELIANIMKELDIDQDELDKLPGLYNK